MKLDRIVDAASVPMDSQPAQPTRVEDAARQFESLLVSALLKAMREAGSGGWLCSGEDQASATAMELAEEQFAQALAARGGLGLAALVVEGLKRTE